jgi:hypothetical protein
MRQAPSPQLTIVGVGHSYLKTSELQANVSHENDRRGEIVGKDVLGGFESGGEREEGNVKRAGIDCH